MKMIGIRISVALVAFAIGVLVNYFASSFFTTQQDRTASLRNDSENLSVSSVETDPPAGQMVSKARRFSGAGAETDDEVIDFWLKFQKAIAADDRATVASMANYPLRATFASDPLNYRDRYLKSSRDFLRVYDRIFDPAMKAFIANTSSDDIWGNYNGVATPRGQIWIGLFCNDDQCKKGHKIKLRTIWPNSVFIDR